jgi:hypothetical protein
MPLADSEWLNCSVILVIWTLCQPINHVYSYVDLNYSNLISASLPARGQKFRRFSADVQFICKGAKNCEIRFIMSVRLSVSPYNLNSLYRNVSWIFENISRKLESNIDLGKRTISILMPVVRSSVGMWAWKYSSANGCVIIKFVCSNFQRSDEEIQQLLKYDKNNSDFMFKSK